MVSTDPQIKVSHSQFELIHNRQALTLTPRGGDRVCDSNPEDSPQAADLESCTQTHTRTHARVRAHKHTHTHTFMYTTENYCCSHRMLRAERLSDTAHALDHMIATQNTYRHHHWRRRA